MRWIFFGAAVSLAACGGATASVPTSSAAPSAADSSHATSGELVTYKSGKPLWRERYRDDGDALVSELDLTGHRTVIRISRKQRHAHVEEAGKSIEYDFQPDTVVLENGNWEAFVVAADLHPGAVHPTPVSLLLPRRGTTVPAMIVVAAQPTGGRRVTLRAGSIDVNVEISADGRVTHATVPVQGVEVLPAGTAPPAVAHRDPPEGVTEELTETRSGETVLRGTVWRPAVSGRLPLAVILVGSGATERDGNGGPLRTDMYRELASALGERGVATLRFDKRGVGESTGATDDMTIEDAAADAAMLVEHVTASGDFCSTYLVGHSEGGIVALLVAKKRPVDGIALVSTPGRPFATILREQLARKLEPKDLAAADRILERLQAGHPVESIPDGLRFLFPPQHIRYLTSELQIRVPDLFATIKAPAVIVQGEKDVQVSVADARALSQARHDAKVVTLADVDHVLKTETSPSDRKRAYEDPSMKIADGVVDAVMSIVRPRCDGR